jgi:hypothetical protein
MRPAGWLVLFLVAACNRDEETAWAQVNASDDRLSIEVGVEELLDPVGISLRSSTGEVEIGYAEVRPGGGPVGTQHEIVVVVDDPHQDLVERTSVRADSGERGEDEFDLVRDSADEGYYKITLESVGAEGELRTDTLTVRLWQAVAAEEAVDGGSTDE